MKRKVLVSIIVCFCLILSACGSNNTNSKSEESTGDISKGTKENPYTMEDTISIKSYAWDGYRISGGTVTGSNTFELSNFRIEVGNLSTYDNTEDVEVLVFDKKCIETCYEDGIGWLSTGDIYVDNFFNNNMQTIDFTNITEEYTNIDETKVVYFEGTTYTEAYAMCKIDNGEIINNSETYSFMRILYYDKNLDEQYVYIKLD